MKMSKLSCQLSKQRLTGPRNVKMFENVVELSGKKGINRVGEYIFIAFYLHCVQNVAFKI